MTRIISVAAALLVLLALCASASAAITVHSAARSPAPAAGSDVGESSAGGTLHRWVSAWLDMDGDARVSAAELQAYFLRVEPEHDAVALDRIARTIIAPHDSDGDAHLTLAEIAAAFPRLRDPEPGTGPEQVHSSFVDENGRNISISWATRENTTTSTVQYGPSADSLTSEVTGGVHTYSAGQFGWQGVLHRAYLPPMPAATTFFYRVGDSAGGWSEVFSLTTPPLASASGVQIFSTWGDMGTAIPSGYRVCQQMEEDHKKDPFNLVLAIGDLAYASVAYASEPEPPTPAVAAEAEAIWDLWERQLQPLAANILMPTVVGNHEKFYNYSAYLNRFSNPAPWGGSPADEEHATFWFSFNYGRVHFVGMSTEHPYTPGSPQYEFLQKDLAKADANRANVPWIVFTGHRPMYSSDESEWDSHRPGAAFQTEIEPLLLQYKVDLYLCGHMHMFERIHPVRNGSVVTLPDASGVYTNPGAPVHVVQGNAGVFEDLRYIKPTPAWSAERKGEIGYGRLKVFNATHLHYESLALESRKPMDEFWVVRTDRQ